MGQDCTARLRRTCETDWCVATKDTGAYCGGPEVNETKFCRHTGNKIENPVNQVPTRKT